MGARRNWHLGASVPMVMMAAASCQPAPAPSPASPSAERPATVSAAAQAPARRSRILFEAGGRPTRLPFLGVSIAGRQTLMLLDTGATTHVLDSSFVREAHLATHASPNDVALDHEGKQIALTRAEGFAVTMEGWGNLGIASILVSDLPPVLAENGVAGILSPQLLVEAPDVAIVDLKNRSIEVADVATALKRLATGCSLTAEQPAQACVHKDGPLFMVGGSVKDTANAWALDTGAIHTDVNASSPASGRVVAASEPGTEAAIVLGGETIVPRVAKGLSIVAGECTFRTDVDAIKGAGSRYCSYGGVLGIDVLRNCTLAMNAVFARGACWPAP